MIVCSRCQFENPVHHRYCQECGDLLVQDVASDHWHENPLDSDNPDREGYGVEEERSPQDSMVHVQNDHAAGAVLLAVCSHPPDGLVQVSSDENTTQYLDKSNRYQLIEPLSDPSLVNGKEECEILILDTQPDAPPYLEKGNKADTQESPPPPPQPEMTIAVPNVAVPGAKGTDLPKVDTPDLTALTAVSLAVPLESSADAPPTIDIPLVVGETDASSPIPMVWTLADYTASTATPGIKTIQTYFDLQDQLYPSFPRLIDAWDSDGAVIVLENRGELVCLKDMVIQPNVVPPQLLHWCHEMTELWEVLSHHQCCQSLLKLDNVRIDEDHILCLRRLYFDESSSQYSLKDLGHLWKTLFGQRSDNVDSLACPDALVSIYQDLGTSAIADIDTLRLRLEAAADQIHHNALGADDLTPESQALGNTPEGFIASDIEYIESQTPEDSAATPEDAMYPDADADADAQSWGQDAQANDPPSGMMGLGEDPTIVLPMQLHTLSNAGLTNIGIQRDHNEDFFSMDTQIHTTDLPSGRVCKAKGLYVLCDGMGGHAAGEVASAAAGDILHSYFQDHWTDNLPDEATIENAIIAANQGIYEQNQADASEGSRRMGTTLVMLLVQDTKAAIAHVGDSRIYRFTRRQGLEQLTVDHEVGQREIARGVAPDVA